MATFGLRELPKKGLFLPNAISTALLKPDPPCLLLVRQQSTIRTAILAKRGRRKGPYGTLPANATAVSLRNVISLSLASAPVDEHNQRSQCAYDSN